MFDYHALLGVAGGLLGLAGFYPYIRDILKGTTKPHPFSWFIWSVVSAIGFFAQLAGGGGAGALVTAAGSFGCIVVTLLSLTRGEKGIVLLDWFSLCGALLSLVFWRLTNDPLAATVLVTLTDALASVPTFRKSYLRPYGETPAIYAIGVLAFSLGLLGLDSFTLTTALFPTYVIAANAVLVGILIIRRKTLPQNQA